MKPWVPLLALLVPAAVPAAVLTGVAKNRMGAVVYLEKHEIQKDEAGFNKFIRVDYSRPDGSTFATMTSDFSANRNLPATTFEDRRFKTKTSLRIKGGAVEFTESKDGKETSKRTVPLDDGMVAGQGFDNFIRANSAKLAERPLEFKFGVLEKKDFYSLTGYRKPSASSAEAEYGIRASNWLLRLFADELRVVYDAKDMRLKSFAGRSNVPDDSGKAQDVVIDYRWEADP